MLILTIDTSGAAVSAAVAETDMNTGRILSYFWLKHGKTHAEALMQCVDAALAGLDLDIGGVDAFAAVSGPGSFTGLRIGLSVVKAFAYASKALTAGISTLDALAQNMESYDSALLCPVMDARRANVYTAIYMGGAVRLTEPAMLGVDETAERLAAALEQNREIGRVVFNGDTAGQYIDFFRSKLRNAECVVAGADRMYQNAASAALLACGAASRGALVPPGELEPAYLNAGYMSRGAGGAARAGNAANIANTDRGNAGPV